MEVGVFRKKGLRSLVVCFVLVFVIEANVYTSWYHTPNEETIKTSVARQVTGKTVKDEWNTWKQKGVFTEKITNGEKEITFSTTAKQPLGKVLGYLNYFPLLEKGSVTYNIPVDGENIKLRLRPDSTGTTFKASFLYPYTDPSGQQKWERTELSNSKRITQELIASTKDHPALRHAIEAAMPKILNQRVKNTGTFDRELQAAASGVSIPNDVKNKAFRNALEIMVSTTVLRKSPENWVAVVNKNIEAQKPNLKVRSMERMVKKQWKEWRAQGLFTEKTNPATNVKEVTFKNGLSISPNEIFHALQHFRQLETGRVQYAFNIDGFPFKFELAPKGANDFTAERVYTDLNNVNKKKDITDISSLRKEIDHDVLHTRNGVLQYALKSELRKIFRFSESITKKNLFVNEVKSGIQRTKKQIPSKVQENVFRNAVDLMAASIMLKKPIPEVYWMHGIYDNIKSDISIKENQINSKAIKDAIIKNWDAMKNKKIFTESNSNPKEVVFNTNADITAKEVFDHLRHFTALESQTVIYKFPIDGQDVKLKLTPNGRGGFTANYLYEDATGTILETELSNTEKIIGNLMGTTQDQKLLSSVLESTLPKIFKAKLGQTGQFETELNSKILSSSRLTGPQPNIPNDLKQKALRQTLEAVASMSLMGREGKTWVDYMDSKMEVKRAEFESRLNKKIADERETNLKLELAVSMTQNAREIKEKWEQLKELNYIETVVDANNVVRKIRINRDMPYTLKDTFRLLQHFHDLYPNQGKKRAEVTIPIGGEDRTFLLALSGEDKIRDHGINQVVIRNKDKYWQGTTKSQVPDKDTGGTKEATPNAELVTTYNDLLDRGLRTFGNSGKLADTMLKAIERPLNEQPDFNRKLEVKDQRNQRMEKETLDTIRGTVEFLITTMISEAAFPPQRVRDQFISDLADTISRKRKFPEQGRMPNLENLVDSAGNKLKEGRSPTADMVTIKLLNEIVSTGARFDAVFVDSPNRFPFMKAPGGTAAGRQYLLAHGDDPIPSTVILEEAAGEHDGQTLAKRARRSCTGSRKRRKRQTCSLEEVSDHMMVDEKSIKVEDTKVTLDLVDRRDASKRKRLVIPITSDELATPQLIQNKISNSERAEGSKTYAKINKGLAVHGLVFSAIGAIDYFQKGDNLHGSIAVSQSLHTLGGLTGFNEIASKAAKKVLRYSAIKVARGLNMERGLEKFSLKVEKYMEKGVGKLMGDLPGVGLAFDIYFIEQDIEALSNLDLNNPEDLKMLPLRVVDLVLDVDTTVLNLIGTFCPEAEIITEPLIIVISIVRMAIDDFYVDIMEEMDKVNWNSPWAGFEFIGALFKGIIEGAADFLSGGLRRQMKNYSKQEKADKKLISSLKDATSYYKITGKKGSKTIDFTQGKLSSFGGFITFRMCDNGKAHLEIGDVTGNHETVTKSFDIGHDVKDIVLGIGESREFLYEKKTAKLWAFIPVKHYKVIKNANLKSSSLFGTYYGNNKNNKFFAVQNQKKNKKQKDYQQCDYGKINIGFVTGHYHYNLYGRGGDDLFYLGPQMSKVTGGQGSDIYIVQSYGGNTIIDNFAEDNKKDMVIINVPYDDISCSRNNIDLDILYRNTHHIRITNWFVPGNTEYYRHVSFKSQDGVIFIAKDVGSGATCTPIAIAKGSEKQGQSIEINNQKFSRVKQVVGTDFDDSIYGNDLSNILDGGKGMDFLRGGKSEDTYIIRAGEGCDKIDNFAEDYKKTTDIVIFNVNYERILLQPTGQNLKVLDSTNGNSCVEILNWLKGEKYRHMIFTSLDHVVFKIKKLHNQYTKFPMVLDYSKSKEGVKVDLNSPPIKGYTYQNGFEHVATVSDSTYTDHIKGNKQSNFLSCTGGRDVLFGGGGSDNYIVKKSCEVAHIINLDAKEKVDLLLIDYKFQELTLSKQHYSLIINYDSVKPKVILSQWYTHSIYRHIWVRSNDGMTLRINGDSKTLEPVEISKDPEECLCKGKNCQKQHIIYDLRKSPWKTVTRFQLKSSSCSYNIIGNDLNNYIDPGSGNGYSYQHLRGGNGADTYVLKHGYGEFNVINNAARDNKTDTLKLGLEVNDIRFSFYGEHDVILASKSRPKSLTVRIKNYFKGPENQHLQVITSDQVTFEITQARPFIKVISMDLSQFESPQNLTSNELLLSSKAQSVKGAHNYPNQILGTSFTREIEGGFKEDVLVGGPGDNIIKGRQGNDELFGGEGNDIIFGGDGDDFIKGGDGNDYIYGGDGADTIDGGSGGDTICFKGEGFDKKGVHVDLSGGFGKGVDAEGDTYTSIEHVYGTIHNDTLIGSNSDNNLHGLNGGDVIISMGGDDQLVGGDGKDRYILDNAYGIKTIDNYAKDQVKDTLSLANTYSDDVCVFLVGNNLHLQVKQKSLSSLLYHKRPLTVIVFNWNKSYRYRHLNILFKDSFWPSHALGKSKQFIDRKTNVVQHIVKKSSFAFTSGSDVGLSWNPNRQSLFDDRTQMEVLQYDVDNPQNSKRIELSKNSISNGKFTPVNLTRNKHYVFALLLKYCSAIIASSYSLTYLGEKRSCSALNVANSRITYMPQEPLAHGSSATLTCLSGYKFKSSYKTTYTETCLDGKWEPKIPTCIAKANCRQLTQPEHGQVNTPSTSEDALAIYACDKGFELLGSKQRRCGKDGQWSGEEPKCERINCFQLPNVKHGNLTQCNGNSVIYGTMQSPKHGFCVKRTCNANYVEHWRMKNHDREFEKLLPGEEHSTWFCRGSTWRGVGDLACLPAMRLTETTSTWHENNGVFQEWDDANGQWKNSLSRDTKKHQLACANSVGVENYKEKIRILSSDSQRLKIACPKIRFGKMITKFEGKLETLIEGNWHPTCLVGPDTNRRLENVYEHMCTEIGLKYEKPGIATSNHGQTSHILACSDKSSDINSCKVKKFSVSDCVSLLQCKRRCNNVYPVDNAKNRCTGDYYEDDTCKVACKFGFKLIGPDIVYCKGGVWSDSTGKPAVSRCDEDKNAMVLALLKKLFPFFIVGQ